MKWRKLGKIFDPTEHKLPNDCLEFAQSPQALVLGDRVRVYFSTRCRDELGKYLSHIAYVDFDRDMHGILDISKHTVIELGGLGAFDEHGIFPMHVFDDGDKVLGFTTGFNRKISVGVDSAIGVAISKDSGRTFQKHGTGPIMAASLNEPFLIADSFVMSIGGIYYMWYIFGTKWKSSSENEPPDRVYKIACATSVDAINWQRDGKQIISDRLGEDECQALPTVFRRNDLYHMYFCFRPCHGFRNGGDSYRLGYAYSHDQISWTRDDSKAGIDLSQDGWDSQMQCYPHVFACDDKVYMLYNGNEFGKFGFGLAELV
ncbi:hypothetical protein [Bradyrhizobium betae]|uniref:Glycosylase n=1 Tax=Bradyrhizobium betae TaxID=244734 RepID=A0A4V1P7C8_9BRAD|nr:hypothetical protein [Bradyrhizobium betae]RXT50659.1 hypothetical protein B5V03_06660 [Bradyrhizobium betae]